MDKEIITSSSFVLAPILVCSLLIVFWDNLNNNETPPEHLTPVGSIHYTVLDIGATLGTLCSLTNPTFESSNAEPLATSIAELLHFLMRITNSLDIDITKCIRLKQQINARKYPVSNCGVSRDMRIWNSHITDASLHYYSLTHTSLSLSLSLSLSNRNIQKSMLLLVLLLELRATTKLLEGISLSTPK